MARALEVSVALAVGLLLLATQTHWGISRNYVDTLFFVPLF
jgi:hypothetical protein